MSYPSEGPEGAPRRPARRPERAGREWRAANEEGVVRRLVADGSNPAHHGAGAARALGFRGRFWNDGIVAGVTNRDAHRATGSTGPLALQLRATPESVGTARRALAAYCAQQGAARATTDRVLLSVSEAVTNALIHAYRYVDEPADERIELEARCHDAALVVIVRDFGCGMSPRLDSPGLGLGLPLIAASTSSVQIDAPPEGGRTEISMEFDLAEPVLELEV